MRPSGKVQKFHAAYPGILGKILADPGVDAVLCIYCSYTLPKYAAFDAFRHLGALAPGVSHLGVQVERDEELSGITARLRDAGIETSEERDVSCCYSRQDKSWVSDPQGVRWEAFRTHNENPRPGCCA